MNVLGVTVVIVALPSIGRALGISEAELQWVASAYALFFGGFLLLGGRAADLYGRRLFFMAGLALFVAASLACGLSESYIPLVGARAVQGLGAAMVMPAALSILTTIFEGEDRNRAVGVWTAVAAGGGAAGFFLGGVVSEGLGWEWVFFLNVPVGTLGLVLAPVLISESRDRSASRSLDVPGALSITGGLLLLIYGLTRAEAAGFDPATLGALALAALLVVVFLAIEAHAATPLVPLRVFRLPTLAGSSLVAFFLTAITSPLGVLGTLYLQNVLGYSPTVTGLAYAPFSIAVVVGSIAGSRLTGQTGPRSTMVSGLAALALATVLATAISTDSGLSYLLAGIVLSGWGLGCASVASTAAGISAVPGEERGLASGLLNAAAQVGTAIGIAALGAVAAARTGAVSGGEAPSTALVEGYRWAFFVAAALAPLGMLAALSLVPTKVGKDSAVSEGERGDA